MIREEDDRRTATRTDARIVDICPRCGADVERCFFCDASARHFVGEPGEACGGRTLHVCDQHLVLLNVEDGSFRDEVPEELGSDQWEMGMYAPRDGCWCDDW